MGKGDIVKLCSFSFGYLFMPSIRPRWPYPTKIVISLLLLALFLYLLSRFREAIPPFILAAILAFVLTPAVNGLAKRLRERRTLAILICYVILLGVAISIPVVITPILATQIAELNLDMQRISVQVESAISQRYTLGVWTIDVKALSGQVTQTLQGVIEPMMGQTFDLLLEAISSVVWLIFIMVVAFYLIRDGAILKEWAMHLVPSDYLSDFAALHHEITQIWSAFFRGQLTLALVVGIIFTLIGWIIGLPFALAMGILAGLLEFLPSIGHGIWLMIATVLALFVGSTWIPLPNWAFAILIAGLHIFFQQFDLNYLIPRIIGSRMHLSPLVVILGIVAGALLAGVLGIPLAAPTIASARVIGRYIYANLLDLEPFPGHISEPLPPPNLQWWRRG
jgi:predicted PurR-regulated permease PerM